MVNQRSSVKLTRILILTLPHCAIITAPCDVKHPQNGLRDFFASIMNFCIINDILFIQIFNEVKYINRDLRCLRIDLDVLYSFAT